MSGGKPRIIIDARMVGPVMHGFGRYVSQLARGLSLVLEDGKSLPYEPVFLVGRKLARSEASSGPFSGFATVEMGAAFLSPLELLEIPRVLRKTEAALYHSPTFSSLASCPVPWVVTVHDLNHLTYGGFYHKVYYERLLKPFARKAARLLTVSEFSRRELAAWSGIAEAAIGIVPNSIDLEFATPASNEEIAEATRRHGLERGRYFFCLTNPKPHKNAATLLGAFSRYRRGHDGAEPWKLAISVDPASVAGVAGEPSPGVVALPGLPDADARALMAGAGAVAFPSLYEGFGLPPVEAASMGIPVLVSRIAPHEEALRELGPGETTWVDARDEAGWAEALHRAASGGLAAPSVESRQRLLRRFDVMRMGENMDRVYRDVLGL